jgi:cation:H+ antiporter
MRRHGVEVSEHPVAFDPAGVAREGNPTIMIHFVSLIACAIAIYLSCEWFVNAVEWLGRRLKVGPLAVGTVLAAFGTALPESVVTFVAVVFGHGAEQKDIGIGAAMGGPLALATVAYGVTGAMMVVRRRARRREFVMAGAAPTRDGATPGTAVGDGDGIDTAKLARDQRWFLAVFLVKVTLGLVAFAVKPWLGLLFFAAYAVYFWREIRTTDDHDHGGSEELAPLRLQPRRAVPTTAAVITQTLGTLALIFAASQLFVAQLEAVGPMLGLSASVTALLLSPIATELPEIMNAVIWVRQGKTPLALANISGAMMIQATVPSGLGLLFTPWRFTGPLLLSGLITIAAIVYLLVLLNTGRFTATRIAAAAAFYLLFAVGLVAITR